MTRIRPGSLEARRIRRRLDDRRRALIVRYKDAVARADAELADREVELVDIANDQWDARVLSAMTEVDADALANIVGAMRRLERGEYGVCVACGAPIARDRLRVVPEAAECADCAASAETRRPRWVEEIA